MNAAERHPGRISRFLLVVIMAFRLGQAHRRLATDTERAAPVVTPGDQVLRERENERLSGL